MSDEVKNENEEGALTSSAASKNLAKKLTEIQESAFKNTDAINVTGDAAVKKIVNKPNKTKVKLIKPKGLKGLQSFAQTYKGGAKGKQVNTDAINAGLASRSLT